MAWSRDRSADPIERSDDTPQHDRRALSLQDREDGPPDGQKRPPWTTGRTRGAIDPSKFPGLGWRYRLMEMIAEGGAGQIFRAADEGLRREVAVKVIQPRLADDSIAVARFQMEAEITAKLDHVGVVPVHDVGFTDDGRPFYVMRYFRGETLKTVVARYHDHRAGSADLALRRMVRRLFDACHVVDYAHRRGVVHRDLKPANLLVSPYNETLVVDWGLAKLLAPSSMSDLPAELDPLDLVRPSQPPCGETVHDRAVGTPAFMSPEQADGRAAEVGPRADIYSLGATLYTILTGRPPYHGETIEAIVEAVKAGTCPPPDAIQPHLPSELVRICVQAMARSPDRRHASALALAADLERWLMVPDGL